MRRLRNARFTNLLLRTRGDLDLRNQQSVDSFFDETRPEFVILAAARVGGILANDRYPASFIGDNLLIQNHVLHAAHRVAVKRLIFVGSTCIYPRKAPQPLREEHLLTGPLESTNQWYAIAKIAGVKMCQAFRKQHGCDFLSLMSTNLYGPGDNFDLQSSHVLPALLRKFHEAKTAGNQAVTVWGTGAPRREFLYNEDLADACLFVLRQPEHALAHVAPDSLLNVGVGADISIGELAALIREVTGSTSPIVYDRTKPDGTPRKLVDISRIQRLGWKAMTPLRQGIAQTYAWYLDQGIAA